MHVESNLGCLLVPFPVAQRIGVPTMDVVEAAYVSLALRLLVLDELYIPCMPNRIPSCCILDALRGPEGKETVFSCRYWMICFTREASSGYLE